MGTEIGAGPHIDHAHVHTYANDALMQTYRPVCRHTYEHTCIHTDDTQKNSHFKEWFTLESNLSEHDPGSRFNLF